MNFELTSFLDGDIETAVQVIPHTLAFYFYFFVGIILAVDLFSDM